MADEKKDPAAEASGAVLNPAPSSSPSSKPLSATPKAKRDVDRAETARRETTPDAARAETTRGQTTPDAAPAEPAPRRRANWLRLTVIVLFALLYAYDLFEAVTDTFGVAAKMSKDNENRTLIGLNPVAIPWWVLVANMLLPPVVFGLALVVARRRNLGILVIVLLAGLAVVAALYLSLGVLVRYLT